VHSCRVSFDKLAPRLSGTFRLVLRIRFDPIRPTSAIPSGPTWFCESNDTIVRKERRFPRARAGDFNARATAICSVRARTLASSLFRRSGKEKQTDRPVDARRTRATAGPVTFRGYCRVGIFVLDRFSSSPSDREGRYFDGPPVPVDVTASLRHRSTAAVRHGPGPSGSRNKR